MSNLIVAGLSGIATCLAGLAAYYAATQQNRLSTASIAADWLRDLRGWASESVDVLTQASYTCRRGDPEPTADERTGLHRCRHRLSALIDRGRFLLPNEREQDHGRNKAAAYRGLRHHALDALVAAERILGRDADLRSFPDRKSALIEVRREYVSTVQGILDPRSTNKMIARILRVAQEERQKDPSMGGLLPDPKLVPVGADGLLDIAALRYKKRQAYPSRP